MPELTAGDLLGGCRVESVIARGGMGVVYRAVQLDLQRPVALKVIAAHHAEDPEFRERFGRESRMAAAIDHPNVVPVYAAGEDRGALYIVMRFVAGSDLHALVKSAGRLPAQRAAGIVAQVASALDAAHAAGLVHRDVKPANVLLASDVDHAYLSDFGLMRALDPQVPLTDSGRWMGTVDFAAPEQLRGERVDARSDVYSLGCVLFAALAGTPPFARGTVPATLLAHLHDPPPRPSAGGAPAYFDRVVARALAKDPDDRYPSAGDLGRAAVAAGRGEPVTESERTVAIGPAAPDGDRDQTAPTAVVRRSRSRALEPAPPPAAMPPAAQAPPAAMPPAAQPGAAHPPRTAMPSAAPPPPAVPRAAQPPAAPPPAMPPVAPPRTAVPRPAQPPAPLPPARPRPAQPPAVPTPAVAPDPAGPTTRRRRRLGRRGFVAALALPLAGIATVAVLMLDGDGDGDGDLAAALTIPLTEAEVRTVAEAFAQAYETEDGRVLRRLLSSDVQRVLPAGSVRGRNAVVTEYESQFRANATQSYELEQLAVRGGRAGRASARYRVRRAGASSIAGRIVFGVVRDRGRPRIALITVAPER
jgi:predicted Ser/Thr protein kinase